MDRHGRPCERTRTSSHRNRASRAILRATGSHIHSARFGECISRTESDGTTHVSGCGRHRQQSRGAAVSRGDADTTAFGISGPRRPSRQYHRAANTTAVPTEHLGISGGRAR